MFDKKPKMTQKERIELLEKVVNQLAQDIIVLRAYVDAVDLDLRKATGRNNDLDFEVHYD